MLGNPGWYVPQILFQELELPVSHPASVHGFQEVLNRCCFWFPPGEPHATITSVVTHTILPEDWLNTGLMLCRVASPWCGHPEILGF